MPLNATYPPVLCSRPCYSIIIIKSCFTYNHYCYNFGSGYVEIAGLLRKFPNALREKISIVCKASSWLWWYYTWPSMQLHISSAIRIILLSCFPINYRSHKENFQREAIQRTRPYINSAKVIAKRAFLFV